VHSGTNDRTSLGAVFSGMDALDEEELAQQIDIKYNSRPDFVPKVRGVLYYILMCKHNDSSKLLYSFCFYNLCN
jgi:hypothetical protein